MKKYHDGYTIREIEFTDTHVEYLYNYFNILLAADGVKFHLLSFKPMV